MRNPSCTRCLLYAGVNTVCVPADGHGTGKVMLIGEAPGKAEDEVGRPFIGPAGKMLDRAIAAAGLTRDDFVICNAVRCRPPENATPTDAQLDACLPYLVADIEEYRPRAIVTLGGAALRAVTGNPKAAINRHRGRLVPTRKNLRVDAPITATFHPSAVLHGNRLAFDNIVADLKSASRIGRGDVSYTIQTVLPPVNVTSALNAIESIAESSFIACDLEWTASEQARADEKVKIRYPWTKDAELFSIALAGWRDDGSILSISLPWPLPGEVREAVVGLLSDRPVAFHNAMGDLIWLLAENIRPNVRADTLILTYLIDETQPRSLDAVATRYAGMPLGWKREVQSLFLERPATREEWERLLYYNAEDTYATLRSLKAITAHIKASPRRDAIARLHSKLLMPVLPVLARAALEGVGVDRELLEEESRRSYARREEALQQLSEASGLPPARMLKVVGSTQQTISYLRGLGLELKSSKKAVLATVKEYPEVQSILAVRKETKYLSTYFTPWRSLLDKMPDGRLHTVYRPTGTRTNRLSAALDEGGPLMVAPRNDKNVKFRALLRARPGYLILAPDYSQLEMRVTAWLAPEPTMADLIRRGVDLHLRTAMDVDRPATLRTGAEILGRPPDDYQHAVDIMLDYPELLERFPEWGKKRQDAKGVNFGYVFGMAEETFISYALVNYDLVFTPQEATHSRQAFMTLYSQLPAWHRRQLRQAQTHGYADTPFGHRRHFDDPNDTFAAINSPVQTSAHAITLVSLGRMQQVIDEEHIDAVIIGELHDSILFEVHERDAERLARRCVEEMENPDLRPWGITLPVPLKVDVKLSERWG